MLVLLGLYFLGLYFLGLYFLGLRDGAWNEPRRSLLYLLILNTSFEARIREFGW